MKKIVLSAVAIAAITTFGSASELSELKEQMEVMAEKIAELEAKQSKMAEPVKNATQITSKSPTVEMSGTHYIGFVSSEKDGEDRVNKFETRRNYIQTKAYFKENPKDYLRVTLDTFQETKDTLGDDYGSWEVRLKYAYLYLDEILPNTGVEIGQVHRPWIDYEEHYSWLYRSISKVFVEDKGHGPDFTNSADLGVNFKTKTPYFSSELGLFNGEGYHAFDPDATTDNGLSGEWRLTGHLLGNGKEKTTTDLQYANVSFFGQRNSDFEKKGSVANGDFNWYGVHAVYNQPEFLLAAQYVKTQDAAAAYEGKGYSFNGEYRFMPDFSLIGMYTKYDFDNGDEKSGKLGGLAYSYNKNVKFIANYLQDTKNSVDTNSIMATAEVNW